MNHENVRADRVKRTPPKRGGPIRNASLAFRSPEPPKGGATEPSVIDRAVDSAYRVVEEYMKEGEQAARNRKQQQHTAVAPPRSAPEPPAAPMHSFWNLAQLVFHWASQMARSGAPGPFGAPPAFGPFPPAPGNFGPGIPWGNGTWGNVPWMAMQWLWAMMSWWTQSFGAQGPFGQNPPAGLPYPPPFPPPGPWGAEPPSAFPWYPPSPQPPPRADAPWNGAQPHSNGHANGHSNGHANGHSNGNPWGSAATAAGPAYSVAVSSVNPADVMVDLHDRFAATRDLAIHDLRPIHGDAILPASAIALEHEDGRLRVDVTLAPDQQPGVYMGRLVDKQTGAACGALRISIGKKRS